MDDVLEMAEMLLRTRNTDALALVQTVEALAAEVRELRKDRARLDWMLVNDARLIWSMRDQKHYAVKADGDVVGVGAYGKKAAIDAAMGGED